MIRRCPSGVRPVDYDQARYGRMLAKLRQPAASRCDEACFANPSQGVEFQAAVVEATNVDSVHPIGIELKGVAKHRA